MTVVTVCYVFPFNTLPTSEKFCYNSKVNDLNRIICLSGYKNEVLFLMRMTIHNILHLNVIFTENV